MEIILEFALLFAFQSTHLTRNVLCSKGGSNNGQVITPFIHQANATSRRRHLPDFARRVSRMPSLNLIQLT